MATNTTPRTRLHPALPGLAACLAGAVLAWGTAKLIGLAVPGFNAMLAAILIGVIATNVIRLPDRWEPGIAVAAKPVLRTGVVLLGFGIGVGDILGLGWPVLVVAIAVVVIGITVGVVSGRALGMSREQAWLTASGCSICGAAAVAAVDGTLSKRRAHETATAVAIVVVYGTAMIAVGPLLVRLLGLDGAGAGTLIGAGIHEVAQVVAAGGIVGPAALTTAVIVKLARVLLLAPVMAVLGIAERRAHTRTAADDGVGRTRPPLVPLFIIGFLIAVAIRSTGWVPEAVLGVLGTAKTWCFLVAMVALGTGVRRETLTAAGLRPFLHGGIVTVVVVAVAGAGAVLVG